MEDRFALTENRVFTHVLRLFGAFSSSLRRKVPVCHPYENLFRWPPHRGPRLARNGGPPFRPAPMECLQ